MKLCHRFLVTALAASAVVVAADNDDSQSQHQRRLQLGSVLDDIYKNLGSFLNLGYHWYSQGEDGLSSAGGIVNVFPVEGPVRVNCGGAALTDADGKEWAADQYFTGGMWAASANVVSGGTDFPLFQTFRSDESGEPLEYNLPLTKNAAFEEYVVDLYFGRAISNPTDFSVSIKGSVVHTADDILAASTVESEGPYTILRSRVVSDGGLLNIKLNPGGSDLVWISAIEVFAASITPAPTPLVQSVPTSGQVDAPKPPVGVVINPTGFQPILINSGGLDHKDANNNTWVKDQYFSGGGDYVDASLVVEGTADDIIYQTERWGTFSYKIPLPVGSYSITLHFCEIFFTEPGQRLFDVWVEDEPSLMNVDILEYAGSNWKATTMDFARVVSDGFLDLSFVQTNPAVDNPKLSGIQIDLVEAHLAHAVSGGPYRVVDTDDSKSETISVDGSFSHTHAPDAELVQFLWRSGVDVIGDGEKTRITLPVGTHDVSLTVKDSAGNTHTEATSITVLSSKFPALAGISPNNGPIAGGTKVVLKGSGFGDNASELKVKFGVTELDGRQISLVDDNTIEVIAPSVLFGAPAPVSIVTKIGESNYMHFEYVAGVPIEFQRKILAEIDDATVAAFGPDLRLYVGTNSGKIIKLTFAPGTLDIVGRVESMVSQWRSILGIAFDPMQTADDPNLYVYFANSFFFHGEVLSSSGHGVNGVISRASGENLDVVETVISGLPVSDHDHGVNGIEFGDNGELYIQVGGNTNAGVPGKLTGNQKQKEGYLSAATLVADLSSPTFDGEVVYDALDDGDIVSGDVEVFAAGVRNPYAVTLHSNGLLYGTDNGPNVDYGDVSTGCNTQGPEVEEEDKINLLERGNYYGHANRKRGETDPRQCTWHSQTEASTDEYTAPLLIVPSSTCGIIEFQSNHFGGQMKGNLIVAKFMGELSRVILSPDGRGVVPQSVPAIPLSDANGLDVVQAPMGELIEVSLANNTIFVHEPIEEDNGDLEVLSVFPRRGGLAGGSTLNIYGRNFEGKPTVRVGGKTCTLKTVTKTSIQCTLPGGSGNVDVSVALNGKTSTLSDGYRFIKGTSA